MIQEIGFGMLDMIFTPMKLVDDVDFLKELASIYRASNNLSVDKTFATGMSNGGDMCYMLACEASDTFSAVVSSCRNDVTKIL